MIKKYNQFVSEKYNIDGNDPPEATSFINNYNKAEDMIKEFGTKKVTISNIYLTYKDENDLINKLSAQKFIDKSAGIKNITFLNPIIGLWAQACQKRRELTDIENQLKSWQSDISNEKSNIQKNPSSKETSEDQISLVQDKTKLKQQELEKKKVEIANLEKATRDKLEEIKKEIGLSKGKIDTYRLNKPHP